jgi:hypothetical protein
MAHLVMAHRIVWKMFNGDEPDFIDHINGVRSDNRIENLRPATKTINKLNESLRADSQSGFIGYLGTPQTAENIKMGG